MIFFEEEKRHGLGGDDGRASPEISREVASAEEEGGQSLEEFGWVWCGYEDVVLRGY